MSRIPTQSMRTRKIIAFATSILFILVAFMIITAAILPYTTLKALAGSFMPDGNFKTLTENNVIIFRILLGWIGLSFAVAGVVIVSGHVQYVTGWLHQYFVDLWQYLNDLRPRTKELFPILLMSLVIVCAATIRMDHLNEPISHDEAYTYVVYSSTSVFNIVTNYQKPNNHVLNSLLIRLSARLFGGPPWAVRLPALIAGLLLIVSTYALARQIYDKYTGLLSAILVAILPGAIQYSTRGRGYVFVAFFTMFSLLLANYLRKKDNLFAWSLLAICSALGFYSVPVMIFPFGMVFSWLFLENLFDNTKPTDVKIKFVRNWIFTGIISAALVLLLYTPIFIYSGLKSVFSNPWVLPEPWRGYIVSIPSRAMDVWHDWTVGLPFILGVLFLIGFCLSLLLHRKITRTRFPMQLAAFLAIGILVLIQRPRDETKIWTSLQAPFMIWCAAGIMGLIHMIPIKSSRKAFLATGIVLIALLATSVTAFRIFPHLRDNWVAKGPVENTANAIKTQLTPSDLIIVDAPFDASIWYYSKINGVSEAYFYQSRPFEHLFVIVSPTNGQTLQSILLSRGPEIDLVNTASAQLAFSIGFLETYIVPHR